MISIVSTIEPSVRSLTQLRSRNLRTVTGEWIETLFYDGREEAVALSFGNWQQVRPLLCRIHSYCFASHALLSIECDCSDQLAMAQRYIAESGAGVIVVLQQDGRGFGQQVMIDVVKYSNEHSVPQSEAFRRIAGKADAREYATAVAILEHMGITSVQLLSNNPDKMAAIRESEITLSNDLRLVVEDLTDRPELCESYADKRAQGHSV